MSAGLEVIGSQMSIFRLLARFIRKRAFDKDTTKVPCELLIERRRSLEALIEELREEGIGVGLVGNLDSWIGEIPMETSEGAPEPNRPAEWIDQLTERGSEFEELAHQLLTSWAEYTAQRNAYRRIVPAFWDLHEPQSQLVWLFENASTREHLAQIEAGLAALNEELARRVHVLKAQRDDWKRRLGIGGEEDPDVTQSVSFETPSLEKETQDLRSRYLEKSMASLIEAGARIDAASAAQLDQAGCPGYREWRANRPRSARFFMDRLAALRDCGSKSGPADA